MKSGVPLQLSQEGPYPDNSIQIYKILFFSIVGILIIASIVAGFLYLQSQEVYCKNGDVSYINGEKTCVVKLDVQYLCENGTIREIDNELICEIIPKIVEVCNIGVYNNNTKMCEIIINQSYICNGTIQEINGELSCILVMIENETHSECQNNACVEIVGTGTNHCSIDSDCIQEDLPDVPWSMFFMHVEGIERYNQCFDDIVNLADEYNTPLTLMLWPQIRDLIRNDPVKLAKLRQWQANGHEFGIHVQGCYGNECDEEGLCLKEGDAVKYEELYAPFEVKTAHVAPAIGYTDCSEFLPDSVEYLGLGKFDGRNSISLQYDTGERVLDTLFIKGGYGTTPERINQYATLNSDEIYTAGNHAECNLEYLEDWFIYLSEQDPEGLKRKTQSWLMENVIYPQGRNYSIEEIENSVDSRVIECIPLIGDKVFQDVYWYEVTDIFNFGRCVATENYCYAHEECQEPGYYFPQSCDLRNIDNLIGHQTVSEMCPFSCGDDYCSMGEGQSYGAIYCPEDCEVNLPKDPYCGDGICDAKENKLENCLKDCDGTTVGCDLDGDGVVSEKEQERCYIK